MCLNLDIAIGNLVRLYAEHADRATCCIRKMSLRGMKTFVNQLFLVSSAVLMRLFHLAPHPPLNTQKAVPVSTSPHLNNHKAGPVSTSPPLNTNLQFPGSLVVLMSTSPPMNTHKAVPVSTSSPLNTHKAVPISTSPPLNINLLFPVSLAVLMRLFQLVAHPLWIPTYYFQWVLQF